MTEYRVNLEIFAGPLDLLLYLVRREEVDIYDIPISRITEQYLKYIDMLKILDLEVAADFLVMAATLMELKSIMLLPKTESAEALQDQADPRSELIRQLLEYKKFKDAANLLDEAAEDRRQRFSRPDTIISSLKADNEPELDLDQVSIWTLLEAFNGIMAATGHYDDYSHIADETPIDLYQIEILHRLQTEGAMSFEKIFSGRDNRLVLIGLFLAMLELIRNSLIWAEQPDTKSGIVVHSLTDEPAEQAVQRAIYAAGSQADGNQPEPQVVVPQQKAADTAHTALEVPIPIVELPAEGMRKLTEENAQRESSEETDMDLY
ncbi:MAG: segregation/condensation protein A [Planctomycetota bacterium]|nr:segregation/condensation protein A [Planctomycetota bacterium]